MSLALLTLQCEECWEQITDPEYLAVPERRHGEIICESCYDAHLQECARCLDWYDEDDLQAKPGELIGIWDTAPADNLQHKLQPGYYRVLTWPFFSQPIMGEGRMYANALQFVMDLDDQGNRAIEDAEAVSGPLCPECQEQLKQKILSWWPDGLEAPSC